MAKFKLIAGKHTQKEDTGRKDEKGNPVLVLKTYLPGEIFESRHDLVSRFNSPNAIKFERIDEQGVGGVSRDPRSQTPTGQSPVAVAPHQQAIATAVRNVPTVATLEAMSVKQLQDYAADEEIAVPNNANKGELIKVIRAAIGA